MVRNNPLKRRLIIVSGEGGAGRTTICAALALCAAKRGKRVLVIEFQQEQRIPRIFGARGAGGQEAEIAENIFAVNLEPNLILEEFLLAHIKTPITSLILNSATYKYFVAAAPGLKQLLALGQIMRLEQRRCAKGRRFDYGTIIVDAPLESQGEMFLQVPQTFLRTAKSGTIKQEVQKVQQLLTDQKKASFLIVTLPEESAVDKAIHLYDRVNGLNIHTSCLIVNRVSPRLFTKDEKLLYDRFQQSIRGDDALSDEEGILHSVLRCAEIAVQRREAHERCLTRLRRSKQNSVMEVPLLSPGRSDLERVETISEHLYSEFEPAEARV